MIEDPAETGRTDPNGSKPNRQVWEDLYSDLRRIAHARLRHQVEPSMPGTTSLVHQVYLHLKDTDPDQWESRAHFLRYASVAMRNLIVDEARAMRRLKRDTRQGVAAPPGGPDRSGEILDLHQALSKLAESEERLAKIVECRFFGGLTVEETAEALELSPATVKRGWDTARVWLFQKLEADTA